MTVCKDALKDGELRKKHMLGTTVGNPFGKGSSHCFFKID